MEAEPTPRLRRPKAFKGAAIIQGIKDSAISCTIRNMHEEGAELQVPVELPVPDSFLLYVKLDRVCYRCEVRWRARDRVGVRILAVEPKPRWYAG